MLTSQQKAKCMQEIQQEECAVQRLGSENGGEKGERATNDVLQQLAEALKLCMQGSRGQRQTSTNRREKDPVPLVCWECKEFGHRRRQCPKLQRKLSETSQPGNEY